MKLTFIDAGVLIAAARGSLVSSPGALAILDDPDRTFASSFFVRLEVLPKALFHKRTDESDFYEEFFKSVDIWTPIETGLFEDALRVASDAGLSALDALHVAAALAVGADEFITSEKPGKPIHRVRGVTVRTIHSPLSVPPPSP
ncbi:MAG: PIN domain-containing protein [bacterium]